jgi:response regulator of citrate/malate metabolism
VPSHSYCYRVLYVGDDYALTAALRARLADLSCLVVRCPAHGVWLARRFINAISYTLLLFDEVLADSSGEELAGFVLSLDHRAGTPTLIVREADDVEALAESVRRLLDRGA